ncbi:methyltransferase, putative [Rivularia sp. IAM M-261]|nr:methyltransferase, putative [Calothrix sp. PCC 7716]GJD16070.1 methyltransferase, putative [Rivularia sp. IAM M-261]
MSTYTYEESVRWMRNQPEHSELVKLCYLDEENYIAAQRFALSEEFIEITKLLRLSNSSQKFKILDLGCGNGIASFALASLGHNVVGVDPDNSADVGLTAAQKLGSVVDNGSISTVQAFAESLPFPDSTFDIVYARQALHHFSDLHKGLAECSRVLKQNGVLLATREHVVNDDIQLQEFLENHLLHQLHAGENAHTLKTYISTLYKAGFRKVRTLAPFDNVINHFPTSNADITAMLYDSLSRKIGRKVASFLIKVSVVEKVYRYYLSRKCKFPGRLYSFFCFK